jgi:hypothetical protein
MKNIETVLRSAENNNWVTETRRPKQKEQEQEEDRDRKNLSPSSLKDDTIPNSFGVNELGRWYIRLQP